MACITIRKCTNFGNELKRIKSTPNKRLLRKWNEKEMVIYIDLAYKFYLLK